MQLRHELGLLAVAFGVGYFAQEIQPTLSTLDPEVFTPRIVSWIIGVFAASQFVGFLALGRLADRAAPLIPLRLAALLFLAGSLISTTMSPLSLIVSRLVLGAGCASLVVVLRRSPEGRGGRIFLALNVGLAAGLFLPILNRGWWNTLVALSICLMVSRMPKMRRTHAHNLARTDARRVLTARLTLATCLPLLTAGSFAVFQMMLSNVIVPSVGLPLPQLWLVLTATSLIGALTGTIILSRQQGNALRILPLTLFGLGCVYFIPALAKTTEASIVAIVGCVFLLNALDTIFEVHFSALITQLNRRDQAGVALGLAYMVGSLGRLVVPVAVGEWREASATTTSILCFTALMPILAAILTYTIGSRQTKR